MIKILIDAGHGQGKAHNRGGLLFNEGDENYNFSLLLKREIEKFSGVYVKLTRNSIYDNPSLTARGEMANGFDLFLSTHSNAYEKDNTVRGSEIWLSVRNKGDEELAKMLLESVTKLLQTNNRGIKYKANNYGSDWYGVLRNSGAKLSMLVEWFFHTNMTDSKNYLNNKNELAKIVATLIAIYYKLVKKNENEVIKTDKKVNTDNKGENMYYVQVGAFREYKNAENLVKKLKDKGFSSYIKTDDVKSVTTVEKTKTLKVGDKVRIKNGAKSYTGVKLASFVYNNTYRVDEIQGDRVVLDAKGINTPFHKKDLLY